MPGKPEPSDEAVQKATGRPWRDWFALMEGLGGADHTERARRLAAAHPELSGWWCQSITVGFERAHGLRARHETPAGFQFSVQRTLPLGAEAAWRALVAAPLVSGVSAASWTEGDSFQTGDGATVTVRAVRPPALLRFWWHAPTGRSTVTVDLAPRATGTAVRLQHAGLASLDEMEAFRVRWRAVLDALAGPSD